MPGGSPAESPEPGGAPAADTPRWTAALLALVAVAVMLPGWSAPLLLDDIALVVADGGVGRLGPTELGALWGGGVVPHETLPLRDLTVWVDQRLWGTAARGARLQNLVWYALCAVLAWRVARQLGDRLGREAGAAASVALLFAVHPAHVEAVVWVSGRKDLLAGALALALWSVLLGGLEPSRARRAGWLAAALVALGFHAKITFVAAVAVGFAGVVAATWTDPRPVRQWLHLLGPGAMAAVVGLLWQLDRADEGGMQVGGALPEVAEAGPLLASARLLGAHVALILGLERPALIHDAFASGPGARGLPLLAAGLVTAALAGLRPDVRWRSSAAGAAAMALLLAPYLQWMPFRTWSPVADRFVFLAVLPAAWIAVDLAGRHHRTVAAVLAVVLGVQAAGQAHRWTRPEALFVQAAERAPEAWRAVSLATGQVWLPEGRTELARTATAQVRDPGGRTLLDAWLDATTEPTADRDRVLAAGLRAYDPPPDLARWMAGRAEAAGDRVSAMALWKTARSRSQTLDDYRAAAEALDRLHPLLEAELAPLQARVAASPDDPEARQALGFAALRLGELELAAEHLGWLRGRYPDHPQVAYNLALVELRRERHAEALILLDQAATTMGSAELHNHRGSALRSLGRTHEALAAFDVAVRADAAHWHAALNAARLLRREGRLAEAEPWYALALERSGLPVTDPEWVILRGSE